MNLSSTLPTLVTLLHNTVDNRAEAIVTKCLESALDVQCAVVTCQSLSLFSLLLPITTALWKKRNLSKQNSVHNRQSSESDIVSC